MSTQHPGAHLDSRADSPAVIMAGSGTVVTYREMEERSQRLANLFRAAGLVRGDHVALLMENNPRYFEVVWAAQRCGLYLTPINWHLKPEEAGYIVQDCGATCLVTSAALGELATSLEPFLDHVAVRLVVDGDVPGYRPYEEAIAQFPAEPGIDELEGSLMLYSSGTTGRPKGIKPALGTARYGESGGGIIALFQFLFGVDADTVYLCPAPLYHAAPLGWSTACQRLGATVVVMERFDPAAALEAIERHRVTLAQFVPTHFVRMLKLPEAERARHDLSSLKIAVHAAAPCPVEVKRQMIDWFGPIVHEYYAGSEGSGMTTVDSERWLAHPGTVGTPVFGTIHILDDDGTELPAGEVGQVWFESPTRFEYHNDPEKTAKTFNDRGWSSLGDVGYVDSEGYLYLTDRVSHMIISGGVNIYPQEVENLLVMHPAIHDVAVIGVPNADLGEEVKAVITVNPGVSAGPDLEAEIIAYCRERLSHYKCPVSVDVVDELPRLPTGKLLKRELRQRYWPA